MRTLITAVSLAAAVAASLASPAMARPDDRYPEANYMAPVAGAAVGTAAGVGLYQGWYGSGALASGLGASAASAAVAGGIAGVGTIALLDAVTQPCQGFHALFGLNHGACADGEYVGYGPRRTR